MLFACLKDPEAEGAIIDFDRKIVKSSRTLLAAGKAGISNVEELVAGTLKQDFCLNEVIFRQGAIVIVAPYGDTWIEFNLAR